MDEKTAKSLIDQAAFHIESENYNEALFSAKKAIEVEENKGKSKEEEIIIEANKHMLKAYLHLGDFYKLEEGINILKLLDPDNELVNYVENKFTQLKTLKMEAKIYFKKKWFVEAIEKINSALKIATACEHFHDMKTEYMVEEKLQNDVSKAMRYELHIYNY